ncbi:DCC1-like thiol-disulfide oxidoreductase family protein [Halopiger goleimassiliensis]|uniref:DCC1-like thiol-disulfide oxidoreductase family protein n=1 Tax=Halopiger goleimassiliensis TaxID=1293048 RepID=UPI000677A0CD|nr:DCC1-like thiol-disulfide oxidoreductase family protein [Halopiger goleimassiliensis]
MERDTFVYDDDCGFCTWWADRFADRTDLRIVGFSELPPDLRVRLPAEYESCSHLVTDERVYSCGASIEEAIRRTDLLEEQLAPAADVLDFLRQFEDYERLRERAYRRVADRRDRWGQLLSKTPPARRDSSEE